MKHRFLIQNDIGLALDQINWLLECCADHDKGTDGLYEYENEIQYIKQHLQQAFDNVGENE